MTLRKRRRLHSWRAGARDRAIWSLKHWRQQQFHRVVAAGLLLADAGSWFAGGRAKACKVIGVRY